MRMLDRRYNAKYKIHSIFLLPSPRQLMNNPDMMRQVFDNPMVQNMMQNPDLLRNLMLSNPQMQQIMEVSSQNNLEFNVGQNNSSTENQKGVNAAQRCFVEN